MKSLLIIILAFSSFTTFAKTFDNFLIVVNSAEVRHLTDTMKKEGFVLSKVIDLAGDIGTFTRCPCDNYQIEFKKHKGFDLPAEVKNINLSLEQDYMTDDGKPKVTVEY